MAELEEHPQMAECMRQGPDLSHAQLHQYAAALVDKFGSPLPPAEVRVACMMLQGALFSDAMGRDMMPDLYPRPLRRAGTEYARTFLRMIAVNVESTPRSPAARRNGARPARASRKRREG
jgi:hypothetical protein